MSNYGCNFQCILPEETILSIGGLHHKVQSVDGGDLCAVPRFGSDAREIDTKGKSFLFRPCQSFHCLLPFMQIFLGQLRAAEVERLMERFWYALTETCLAFTVFRDDFNPKFVALFTVLLFLKSFHWLAEERVDYVSNVSALCCTVKKLSVI